MKDINLTANLTRVRYASFIIFFVLIINFFLCFEMFTFENFKFSSSSIKLNNTYGFNNLSETNSLSDLHKAQNLNYIAFAEEEIVYAKIKSDNVYFYSQAINNDLYKIFCLPKSYFVILTDNAGDSTNLFYKASYMDVSGFIKKNEVYPIIGTPQNPFADNLTFSTFTPNGIELRNSPSNSNSYNVVATVPFSETLNYYGRITGEQMIPQMGTTWYYCKYIDENSVYFGYLYYEYCYLLSDITENSENFPDYEGELFPQHVDIIPSTDQINLSHELKLIIIICACIPCFIIIYLLFKPTKLIIDNGKHKKKINKVKKGEYYEYDE